MIIYINSVSYTRSILSLRNFGNLNAEGRRLLEISRHSFMFLHLSTKEMVESYFLFLKTELKYVTYFAAIQMTRLWCNQTKYYYKTNIMHPHSRSNHASVTLQNLRPSQNNDSFKRN